MKINPIHVPKREQNRCSICGSNIVNGVCAVCGWVQIIFPNQVPLEITDFDTQRKEIARNLYKGACTSKKETEELRRTIDAEVSKSKTLEDCLKEEKAKTRAAEQEKERLKVQVDKIQKELALTKKDNQGLVDKVQRLTSQNQSLISERDRANDSLLREREEHRITKNALNAEKDAHNRTKEFLNGAKEKPIEQNPGVVIGTVLFNFNGRTETKDLYEGVCRVKAPSWANISGDLFEINGDKGVYCVWDLNGNMRDRRGRTISPQGATTRNNDVFTIGGLTIKFSLPEIDYDSLF